MQKDSKEKPSILINGSRLKNTNIMKKNRFRSTIKWLESFNDVIDVHCPGCNAKAQLVRRNEHNLNCQYDFQCNTCHADIKEVEKFIYTVKRNCPFCPDMINYESIPTNKVKNEVKVECQGCKTKIRYTPKVSSVFEWNHRGKNVDFVYWYSQRFKGETFWALNDKHLQYLEDFVTAKLRLRSKVSHGMMLVDKLPQFIKDKKNREDLLKIISKLKTKK